MTADHDLQHRLAFVELQVRSWLSVPVELGGGPIGILDVYAVAPAGGTRRRSAPCKLMPGLVATLLAQSSGRLAAWPSSSRSRRTLGA